MKVQIDIDSLQTLTATTLLLLQSSQDANERDGSGMDAEREQMLADAISASTMAQTSKE